MIPAAVTGSVAAKMLPVMNAASAVAAMELADMDAAPAKVTKIGLRSLLNFATKELVDVPEDVGKAAPEVV